MLRFRSTPRSVIRPALSAPLSLAGVLAAALSIAPSPAAAQSSAAAQSRAAAATPAATPAAIAASPAEPPRLVRLLADGRPVFGIFSGDQTPEQGAAVVATEGADFVLYSMERPPFDVPRMLSYMRGMRGTGGERIHERLPVLLRVPPVSADGEMATRERVRAAVDAGVGGIVFPHVVSRAEAEASVDMLPGLWPRDGDEGRLVDVLIIEDREGIARARDIASTPGLSVVFAGPGDLRRAYEGDMEAVEAAIQTVLAACLEFDVACGVTAGADDIGERLEQGFRVIIVTEEAALAAGRAAAERLRDERDARAAARMARAEAEERALREAMAAPRPIEAVESVWIEELTWMEVRDRIAGGATTAIVSTGGIEQNGPYLATGKHNVVLKAACEGIARALGDALCAPVIGLVPEGDHDPPSGHMRYPGTLSLRPATFEAVLEDVASSLRAHGFTDIVLIGDSGGNQAGMAAVAERLGARWDDARVHYVPEFYRYADVFEYMERELGIVEPSNDGLHDDYVITSIMATVDPESVRFDQRVAAGLARINGVDLEPLDRTVEVGRKLLAFRVASTVDAIRARRGR